MVICGGRPPKVHKLSILFKLLRQIRPDLHSHPVKIEALQAYTFVSRYPFIIPGDNLTPHEFMTFENAQECIREAEGVLSLAKEIIGEA